MNCINCIHYEVCDKIELYESYLNMDCQHFKHKDQITELPCYIGQRVWTVDSWAPWGYFKGKVEVREGRVSMLQQKVDKSWKVRVSIGSSVYDYTLDEFRTNACFSEEAAIQVAENLRKEHGIPT